MAKLSLSEQLAAISTPKPADFDVEDIESKNNQSEDEGNTFGFNDQDEEKAREHYVAVGKSSIRDDGIKVDNKKYNGGKVSRQNLYDDEEGSEEGSEEESEEESGEESGEQEEDSDNENQSGEKEAPKEDIAPELSTEEKLQRATLKALLDAEKTTMLKTLKQSNKSDSMKGLAVKNQLDFYENLLDLRIQLQKPLGLSNCLPINAEKTTKVIEDSNEDMSSVKKSVEKAKETVFNLLDKISQIRLQLLAADNIQVDSITLPEPSKKRKLESYIASTTALDNKLSGYRSRILTKWSQKIQQSSGSSALQSTKFKSINQTADIQVNSILADMDRLVKRTCINRGEYKILGEEEEKTTEVTDQKKNYTKRDQKADNTSTENPYIFDDTDFYRTLLKDLIDRRMIDSAANSAANPNALKWSVSAKSKSKKQVDTKASKGRKLRYHVQEKVQNFAAPKTNVFSWGDEQIDELFSGLLGVSMKVYDDETDSEGEVKVHDDEEEEFVNDGLKIFG
ncbi:TRAUB-domain-containing protein [Nadsonia fulvescens var. elongata DSM 6958]|uniref:Protein BFR2 n=1 Tax=Nadsonia fulvescens var. elongata DSM 6958 TaxID=857566 RepID=A0A1E3PM96_9ASCO|nr:TRAUB-domain-containing protein [Nadsonia fulvescens var. elongata DSM 6958]